MTGIICRAPFTKLYKTLKKKKKKKKRENNTHQLKSNHHLIDTRCIFKKVNEEKIEKKNSAEHVLYNELEQTNALHLGVLKENSHSW